MAEAAQDQMTDKNLIDRAKVLGARRRHYETIFILAPGIDEARATEIVDRATKELEANEGQCLRKDDWGKMKMAFEMDKHAQGRYFYFRYISDTKAVAAVERVLKLDADCLRYQSVRLSDDLSEDEVHELVQKAPNEKSKAPNIYEQEEDFS